MFLNKEVNKFLAIFKIKTKTKNFFKKKLKQNVNVLLNTKKYLLTKRIFVFKKL